MNKEDKIKFAASSFGRSGGKVGGKARARNLTHEQIQEIGRLGGLKRAANLKAKKEQKNG